MNKLLIAILLSFLAGQTVKAIIHYKQYRKVSLWLYLEDGGMPSAHAVVTFALTTGLLYETGFSNTFILSAVFTILVLNEAMKVRRQQGINSEFMAKFVDVRDIIRRKMTESTGHTPEQVFVGAVIGFLVSSIIYIL